MSDGPLHPALAIAVGFRYPRPDSLEILTGVVAQTRGVVHRHLQNFLNEVSVLSQAEWEELHTSTLDLSALFVPYVGHVMWGDNYKRGEFMAELKGVMRNEGIGLGGELPDHLEPIMRYLAAADSPLTELVDVLPGAMTYMEQTLKTASPQNPYLHLLAATTAFVADLRPLTIGSRR